MRELTINKLRQLKDEEKFVEQTGHAFEVLLE